VVTSVNTDDYGYSNRQEQNVYIYFSRISDNTYR